MTENSDLIATVKFRATSEGGRNGPTSPIRYGCPFGFEGEYFESFLLLEEIGSVAPGQTATVPIIFLRPEIIKPRLSVGSKFTLWERGTIADGTVEQIFANRLLRPVYRFDSAE